MIFSWVSLYRKEERATTGADLTKYNWDDSTSKWSQGSGLSGFLGGSFQKCNSIGLGYANTLNRKVFKVTNSKSDELEIT